ncbi:purine-nucleoside phosphorylase [Flavihumibacter rivuli]|uniref:purine-nucleoside phosphorylase n=1 Tax=Flavihumibacter rivuli TaxID=2838156 RepID=UPI001BDE0DB9|nr:purine-nucleoside phosphorylase [Flavihumibacter rivuli]ULQ57168.1 purine-nucleoside phosphorylase [Flavihumibacter rivuli]
MTALMTRLQETTAYIQSRYAGRPEVGIVLGSGLGNLVADMKVELEIPYAEIPHFPVSTVEGHSGKLLLGQLGGKTVVAMAGRFHFYEGYAASEVAYPIRVMKQLGVGTLLISNAAGGMNPDFKVGDLMIIRDHISFFTVNPLIGKNEDALGPRFPDMSEPYSKSLIKKAKAIARAMDIEVHKGVYAGVTGPTFETRAEYKLLHILGADAVGMSTVQEVIVARHMDMEVFAISVITDLGIREEENVITHEEVLEAARNAEPKLTAIFRQLIAEI